MKHPSPTPLSVLAALLALLILCLSTPRADAKSKETYWTSVDGVTIWASLTGMQGSTVSLIWSGREYRIPLARLTPESVAKARQLLGTPAAAPVVSSPKIKARTESKPPTTTGEWIPLSLDDSLATATPTGISTDPDAGVLPGKGEIPPPPVTTEPSVENSAQIRLAGRQAIAPAGIPSVIQTSIDAGNRLQDKFYKWGGGRACLEDSGYDCSGSVSYVLIKAGLLRAPLTSSGFVRYGEPGPGRWISVYAQNGHVFMTLCGLRLDTGGHGGYRESGPRWCPNSRGIRGFVVRHPLGF